MKSVKKTRNEYLTDIGLKADPFAAWVAELEISHHIPGALSYKNSLFFHFFTPPNNEKGERIAIRYLRQNCHQFIFGEPGSGKTSLRLWLEVDCRTALDQTLTVTYKPGEGTLQPGTPKQHDQQIANAITIDLIIQILEQLNSTNILLGDRKVQLLRWLLQSGGAGLDGLTRMLNAIRDDRDLLMGGGKDLSWYVFDSDRQMGLEQYWDQVGRYPVRYIKPTREAFELVDSLLDPQPVEMDDILGDKGKFPRTAIGIEAAKAWGYQKIFQLVDGVDNREPKPERMFALLEPLLDFAGSLAEQLVFFKMFLPLEIREQVLRYLSVHNNELFRTITHDTIHWGPNQLKNLIAERFRAAGAPAIASLDILAGDDLPEGLEERTVAMAKGSPRRLVEGISKMIDSHVIRAMTELQLDRADLEWMEQEMECSNCLEPQQFNSWTDV